MVRKFVMPAQAGIRRFLGQTPAFAGVTLLLFFSNAMAEDKNPFTYSPPTCDFSVTFPTSPYTARKCDGEDKTKCYDMTSYTKVYDMESTINFRVTCNVIDKAVYAQYSAEVMEATLRAMTNRSVVKTFDTSFRTEEGYKQAGLVGEGQSGTLPTIYIAQLWIADGSAMSVEAEMIGGEHEDADKLLSEILKSVHFLSDDERKAKEVKGKGEEPKEEEAKEEKKSEEKPVEKTEDKPEEKKE